MFALACLLVPACVSAPVPDPVPDLVRTLKAGKPGERVSAAETLGDLGPKAASAIPALVEVIREPRPATDSILPMGGYLFEAAFDALARIGPRATPVLAEFLADSSATTRIWAALALRKAVELDAEVAVPALVKALADADDRVRVLAAETLAKLGPKAEPAIPALVTAILERPRSPRPSSALLPWSQFRLPTARALLAIGPKARSAIKDKVVPAVVETLNRTDPRFLMFDGWGGEPPSWSVFTEDADAIAPAVAGVVRRHRTDLGRTLRYLLDLGPAGGRAFAGLLADKDPEVRQIAMTVLKRGFRDGNPDLSPLVPQLLEILKAEDDDTRLIAVSALIRWRAEPHPDDVKGVLALFDDGPFLKKKPDPENYPRRTQGSELIGAFVIAGHGKHLVPVLTSLLRSRDKELRELAIDGLAWIGRPAVAALPDLRQLARGDDPELAVAAAVAAARIRLDPKEAEPLVALLKHREPGIRAKATEALGDLRSLAAPYLRVLCPLLKDEDNEVRLRAVRALGEIAPSDPEVVAALIAWAGTPGSGFEGWWQLKSVKGFEAVVPRAVKDLEADSDDRVSAACLFITRIGPGAQAAVPALVKWLARPRQQSDRFQRSDVLRALGAIGPDAREAVPVLLRLLTEAEPKEKREILLCLADIGPGARVAGPDLERLLSAEPDPEFRLLASCALVRIHGDAGLYRAIFARTWRSLPGRSVLRSYSNREVFVRIGPVCPELVPTALDLLRSFDNISDHRDVLEMIARHAPAAKEAIPVLVKLLDGTPWQYPRVALCEALGAFGPSAKDALPRLRELLDHHSLDVVLAARDAIAKIEGKK